MYVTMIIAYSITSRTLYYTVSDNAYVRLGLGTRLGCSISLCLPRRRHVFKTARVRLFATHSHHPLVVSICHHRLISATPTRLRDFIVHELMLAHTCAHTCNIVAYMALPKVMVGLNPEGYRTMQYWHGASARPPNGFYHREMM